MRNQLNYLRHQCLNDLHVFVWIRLNELDQTQIRQDRDQSLVLNHELVVLAEVVTQWLKYCRQFRLSIISEQT